MYKNQKFAMQEKGVSDFSVIWKNRKQIHYFPTFEELSSCQPLH